MGSPSVLPPTPPTPAAAVDSVIDPPSSISAVIYPHAQALYKGGAHVNISERILPWVTFLALTIVAALGWVLLAYTLQFQHDIKKNCDCNSDEYKSAEIPLIIISSVIGGVASVALIVVVGLYVSYLRHPS